MSDFLLDLRAAETRRTSVHSAASLLRFCDDTKVKILERAPFTLVLTRGDNPELWGPYEDPWADEGALVAVAGRIALEQSQWDAAGKVAGPGGLACKAVWKMYQDEGLDSLRALNGNFLAIVYDAGSAKCHLVTDRCGMYLAYCREKPANSRVFCSHPDVLAAVLGESQNLDMTSLAEFLMTIRLTFPYTYYRNIRGLEPGCIYSFGLRNGSFSLESQRRYFDFSFRIDASVTERDLAEDLATAFKKAVRRRTLPLLGPAAVALSGGLDSRALLACARPEDDVRAFTLFDEENHEFKVAKAVASACGADLIPIRRDFDYYGRTAELGVRISGGMGAFTCNHFLGARERLRDLGIENILTGCYCDYLLKGLALNTVESRIWRIQKLSTFRLAFYDDFSRLNSPYSEAVLARLQGLFPEPIGGHLSEWDWLQVERKRAFPLAYEEDLAQRVIPQRVMPWSLPIVDNDIIAVYLRIPPRFKLNASLFKKMLTLLCPAKLLRVPDSNTGAPITASRPSQTFHRYYSAITDRVSRNTRASIASRGSWPDFAHYFCHNKTIESLWARPDPAVRDVLVGVIGRDPFEKSIAAHAAEDLGMAVKLLTQKLWLDQAMRVETGPSASPTRGVAVSLQPS